MISLMASGHIPPPMGVSITPGQTAWQGDESIRSSCLGRTVFVVYDDRLRFYCLVVSENRYASIQFRPQFRSPRFDALHTEHVFALRNILEMKEAIDLRNEISQFRAVGAVLVVIHSVERNDHLIGRACCPGAIVNFNHLAVDRSGARPGIER